MRGYTIADLLVGTPYKGSRYEGVIEEARKREDVWVREWSAYANAYAVRVRATYGLTGANAGHDFWATVFIAEEN